MERAPLLAWYDLAHRDLPWRADPHPYKVWLSEVMAQQTRIETMLPYWRRFLERWPTVEDLAAAPLDEVLAAWSGLGYYSRARNLHAGAKKLAEEGFPRTTEGWRALPGVGPYIAAAVSSIAFGAPAAVVDGNVERVVSRLFRLETADRKRVDALAAELLDPGRPGDWNQAMMELGALICTPRSPRCEACPVAAACEGRDIAETLPRKPPKKAVPELRSLCVAVLRQGRVLLARRPHSGLLAGLWELPELQHLPELVPTHAHGELVHVFSHRRLTMEVWSGRIEGEVASRHYSELGWFDPARLESLGISSLARRCLDLAGLGAQPVLLAAEAAPGPRRGRRAGDKRPSGE